MLGKWNGCGRPAAWRMGRTACPSSLRLRRSAATLDPRRSSAPSCSASAPFRASPPSQKCRGRPCPLPASPLGPATRTWLCKRRTRGPQDTAHTSHPLRRTVRWPPLSSSTRPHLTSRPLLYHRTPFQVLRVYQHTNRLLCPCRWPIPSRILHACRRTSPRLCLHPCRTVTALLAADALTTHNATNTLIPRHLRAVHTNFKDTPFASCLDYRTATQFHATAFLSTTHSLTMALGHPWIFLTYHLGSVPPHPIQLSSSLIFMDYCCHCTTSRDC